MQPGDIVLIDRDCHKSHHYGLVLVGAHVRYLDSYPLDQYSMFGAVPLARDQAGRCWNTGASASSIGCKLILLTNCTFDGIVYDVERVMEECLAIKPDLIFLWDEAWFAFAHFVPSYRQRTAMATRRARCASALPGPPIASAIAKFKESFAAERRRGLADDAPAARSRCGALARLQHAVDPQDADDACARAR